MRQDIWSDVLRKLQAWYLEESPPILGLPVDPILPQKPQEKVNSSLALPATPEVLMQQTEPCDRLFSSRIGSWMQQQGISLLAPISPCLCLGNHSFLDNLAQAMTHHLIPTECGSILPPLHHPLLQMVLIPISSWSSYPQLQAIYPHPTPHRWISPILPLHPIQDYVKNVELKRELWTLLLHQFSSI